MPKYPGTITPETTGLLLRNIQQKKGDLFNAVSARTQAGFKKDTSHLHYCNINFLLNTKFCVLNIII
jgi:hypothetical protein